MASTLLPPGFRFHPTDVELIMYYLKFKVTGKRFLFEAISEINIYKYSPSDLPDKSSLKSKDREWFFFCPRERKYNSGGRMKRATENGYWKTTGKDRTVHYSGRVVGMIKTLVFYHGHPPQGERTDWVMHEYRMEDQKLDGVAQDAFVLCKVFHKNGPGPRNGAQYGAHFDEEEWDNNSPVYTGFLTGDPSVPYAVTNPLPITESSVQTITCGPEVSSLEPSAQPAPCSVPSVVEGITSISYDDTLHSISSFTGDASVAVQDDNSRQKLDHNNQANNVVPVGGLEGDDILSGLSDLPNWQEMFNQASCSFSGIQPSADSYLELADLDIPLNSMNNLEQQMPTQNYNSFGNPQFYYGSGSFSSTQYPLNSAEIQPLADSYLELADLDIPLNSINNLEQQMPTQNYNPCGDPQFYYGVGSFSSTQHPPSLAEVQPSTDSFLDMADFDIPLSPIHNLVQMSTQNYNSQIGAQFYYGGGSSSSISYPVNSVQVPSLAAIPDGVGDVSNVPQVNFDGTTAANGAGNFTFWQASEPMGINRFNNRG